ncbi:MAG: hypothetical protein PHY12_06690 [Eubacteriales bacterium]|nr:hypothetical protein [Eubacteriales bacterium]
MRFDFDGSMSREVLESYLSRAVTAAGLIDSETLEDDLRAIRELGVKFLGRASGIWYMTEDDEEHFAKSKALADRVHAQDPEIILQSCVFEIVVQRMEEVEIPAYVFEAFGLPAEKRCFRLEDALFPEKPWGFVDREARDAAKFGGIPDLNRDEARMWFYYRATRYIDCGYEALHMGQIHLYTANDRGMKKTYELFDLIRQYAAQHARRHKVLMDAHTHGVSVNGKLLFDYHAMPFTRAALPQKPGRQLVLVREGFSEGGENPNGFSGDVMPYLMEYDNWGGRVVDRPECLTREELAQRDWWGFDQIGWFANQTEEERNHFLEYTYRWTQVNNVNAYFEAPLRRMLSDAAVTRERADTHKLDVQHCYQINNPSAACPLGFGQEKALKACWDEGGRLRREYGNPEHLIRYGARDVFDPETGMKLPEKVVVYGSFQPHVGAVANDSNSEITRMYYLGNGTYTLTVVLPYAGDYDYAVSTYGTLSATYCTDRFPRSGSSNKGHFTTSRDNSVVRFRYRFMDPEVTVEIAEE